MLVLRSSLLARLRVAEQGHALHPGEDAELPRRQDWVQARRSTDFVAKTATGGALAAHLSGNRVTVVVRATVADADNIDQAYHRFRAKNVGIDDVLRSDQNAVMLWHEHPSDDDLATITGCLGIAPSSARNRRNQ